MRLSGAGVPTTFLPTFASNGRVYAFSAILPLQSICLTINGIARFRAEAAECARLEAQVRAANSRVPGLTEERNGDRAVLAQLWSLVHVEVSRPDRRTVEPRPETNDLAALKKMAQAGGGDLKQVLGRVLIPESLNANLDRLAKVPKRTLMAPTGRQSRRTSA